MTHRAPWSRPAKAVFTALGLVAVSGCSGASPPQEPPRSAPQSGTAAPEPETASPGYRLEGKIIAIAFRNINKAYGHFTWNVEVEVQVAHLTPRSDTARPIELRPDASIAVRLKQSLPHADLWPEEREAVARAPNPQQVGLKLWRGYRVGDGLDLAVEMVGPNLARPLAR